MSPLADPQLPGIAKARSGTGAFLLVNGRRLARRLG